MTAYDRTHLKLYMRLLDAEADGAPWEEAAEILFESTPSWNPNELGRSTIYICSAPTG